MGSFTISALVPVPPSCGSFEAEEVPHLKLICSGDLHSVATFSEGTASSEGRKAYTTEKGICPKFGRTEELRGDSNRRGENSEDERKGGDIRKMIGRDSFSEDSDRSKGEAVSNESMQQEKTRQEEEKSRAAFAELPPRHSDRPDYRRGVRGQGTEYLTSLNGTSTISAEPAFDAACDTLSAEPVSNQEEEPEVPVCEELFGLLRRLQQKTGMGKYRLSTKEEMFEYQSRLEATPISQSKSRQSDIKLKLQQRNKAN
jgi:hypothetical protein